MAIKVLTSCSGVNFSYHQDQVVDEIDPAVGADLVRHGLAEEVQMATVTPAGQTATVTPAGQTANVRPTGQTRRR